MLRGRGVGEGGSRTRPLHNPDRLARQALDDFARALRVTLLIPAFAAVPALHSAIFVELDSVLLRLGIGGVAYESDALVDL